MREFCTSGSVGGEGGNILTYPADTQLATDFSAPDDDDGVLVCEP